MPKKARNTTMVFYTIFPCFIIPFLSISYLLIVFHLQKFYDHNYLQKNLLQYVNIQIHNFDKMKLFFIHGSFRLNFLKLLIFKIIKISMKLAACCILAVHPDKCPGKEAAPCNIVI